MKRKLILLLSLLMCSVALYAQGCYEFSRNKGLSLFNHGKYAEAKSQFVAARSCPDKPANNDLDTWISRCEDQLVTFTISTADFCNVTNEGTIIDGYGYALYAKKIKYVKPKITYFSKVASEKEVTVDVKILKPDGGMLTGSSSPEGYTYSSKFTLKSGDNNNAELLGWGSSNGGTYSEGTYTMEFWYKGKKLYTKSFYIFAGDGNNYSSSSSSSGYSSTIPSSNSSSALIRGGSWERMLKTVMRNAQTYSGGDKYLGQKKNGSRDGWGIYLWSDDTIYIGEWKNGDFNGGGMYMCPEGYSLTNLPDGMFYAGYYRNDKKTSGRVYDEYGKLMYIDKFDDNNKPVSTFPNYSSTSPLMVITYNNGDVFVGETGSGGKPYGFGLYLWHDGGAWFGFWKSGVRNGSGFYVSDSGSITSGTWDNNTMK